jgi:hypothetical protein
VANPACKKEKELERSPTEPPYKEKELERSPTEPP